MEFADAMGFVWVPIFLVVAVLGSMITVTRRRRKVGPNTALVVYGRGKTVFDKEGRATKQGGRIIVDGGTVVWPLLEEYRELSLGVMTIEVVGDEVMTQSGVKVKIDWVAQLQIKPDVQSILTAARAFLGKTPEEIKEIAEDTLSANFREVVATRTPVQIHTDKEGFQSKVRLFAAPEMESLGLQILSLNARDIDDDQGYYQALGQPEIAEVKKRATIAQAQADQEQRIAKAIADREAREREAKERLAAEQAEITAATAIAEAKKDHDVQAAQFRRAADEQKATADAAYDIQQAETNRQLAERQGAVELERQKQAALAAQQAIAVAEHQKHAEVVVPAEAQKTADQVSADGAAYRRTKEAEAEATATRAARDAEAHGMRETGMASAAASEAKLLAEAKGTEATMMAEAGGTRAKLLGQAEGERQLAEARSAEGRVNLQELALRLHFETQEKIGVALAESIGQVGGNMKVVQFTGGAPGTPGNGQGSNALINTLMQLPELASVVGAKAEALSSGQDVGNVVAQIAQLVQSLGATAEAGGSTKT